MVQPAHVVQFALALLLVLGVIAGGVYLGWQKRASVADQQHVRDRGEDAEALVRRVQPLLDAPPHYPRPPLSGIRGLAERCRDTEWPAELDAVLRARAALPPGPSRGFATDEARAAFTDTLSRGLANLACRPFAADGDHARAERLLRAVVTEDAAWRGACADRALFTYQILQDLLAGSVTTEADAEALRRPMLRCATNLPDGEVRRLADGMRALAAAPPFPLRARVDIGHDVRAGVQPSGAYLPSAGVLRDEAAYVTRVEQAVARGRLDGVRWERRGPVDDPRERALSKLAGRRLLVMALEARAQRAQSADRKFPESLDLANEDSPLPGTYFQYHRREHEAVIELRDGEGVLDQLRANPVW